MALRELFAIFGVDFETKALNQGNAAIDATFGKLEELAGLLGSAWVTQGVYDFTAGVAHMAAELDHAGAIMGLNANEMLAWRTVAEGVGVGAEQLTTVFAGLARNVDAANTGNRDIAKSFEDLGVALEMDGVPRNTSDILADTAAAIARMEDPTASAALAMRLLGEQGARLLPAFEDGAGGLEAMMAQVDSLFGGDLDEAAEQARALAQAQAQWNLTTTALKTTIGLELLPKLVDMVDFVGDTTRAFSELTKGTHVVEVALTLLGAAGAVAGWRMLAPFLPAIGTFLLAAAAIGVVILVVDDLIAMFSGGTSVIAEFVDGVFGVGTARSFVIDMTDAWAGLNLALSDAWAWITGLLGPIGQDVAAFAQWADEIDLLTKMFDDLAEVASDVESALDFLDNPFQAELERRAESGEQDAARARLGESDAAARRRRYREEYGQGLAPVERPTAPVPESDAAARRRRFAEYGQSLGGARVGSATPPQIRADVRQNNPVTINISGGDPVAIGEEVMSRVREEQGRQYSDARDALMSTAD